MPDQPTLYSLELTAPQVITLYHRVESDLALLRTFILDREDDRIAHLSETSTRQLFNKLRALKAQLPPVGSRVGT